MTKNKRFFAFGCSQTRFIWPTWADILGQQYPIYENWGRPGSGNQFIFNSLVECNQRKKFTSDDTVMIMWASTCREDRYVEQMGGWVGQGNIYNQALYPPSWVHKFACDQGYLIRDLALITAAIELLNSWGVKYELFATNNLNTKYETSGIIVSPVIDLYENTINKIKPSMFDIVFNGDLSSKNSDILRRRFSWQTSYNTQAGTYWPNFDDYLSGNYKCSSTIQQELDRFVKHQRDTDPPAPHCVPTEYLDYLDIVLPGAVSDTTREWVNNLRRTSPTEEMAYYTKNVPERFSVNL